MSKLKKYLMDGLLSKGGSTMTEIKISKSIMIIIREGVHEQIIKNISDTAYNMYFFFFMKLIGHDHQIKKTAGVFVELD